MENITPTTMATGIVVVMSTTVVSVSQYIMCPIRNTRQKQQAIQ